ncbi:MAG: hypothetical protein ACOC6G_02460 [Thermoproteota archaeon]
MNGAIQIPALSRILESGEVTLFVSSEKALQLEAKNKKINLNVIDKSLIKDVFKASTGKRGSLMDMLGQLEDIADQLKIEGVTITVSYKGDLVLTLGAASDSKLSGLILRTGAIEVNNFSKLMSMVF